MCKYKGDICTYIGTDNENHSSTARNFGYRMAALHHENFKVMPHRIKIFDSFHLKRFKCHTMHVFIVQITILGFCDILIGQPWLSGLPDLLSNPEVVRNLVLNIVYHRDRDGGTKYIIVNWTTY